MNRTCPQNESTEAGYTLLEAMVAGALVAIMAVSLIPAFSMLVKRGQLSTFKVQCGAIVRAKLQEYVTGAGALSAATTGAVPTGFDYARYRFQNVASSCSATPEASNNYGFRENSSNNTAVASASTTEASLPGGLLGFQLWVNLRRYDPRHLTNNVPNRDCPAATYQFGRLGDAIEITVTGMIRTEPTRANGGRDGGGGASDASYGGIRDLNWQAGVAASRPNPELMCSLSQVVYPASQLFRYYLASDGKIRLYQPTIVTNMVGTVAPAIESHFRSIWVQSPDPGTVAATNGMTNITGFAVSPDNNVVYLLKPGTLVRYTGCQDYTVTVNGTNFPGAPDCRNAPTEVDLSTKNANIEGLAVDFGDVSSAYTGATDMQDDVIYGLRNSGPNANDQALVKYNSANQRFEDTTDYTLPAIPRIKSIFISNTYPQVTAPSLNVIDNTCYFGPAGTSTTSSYCVSVYGSGDATLQRVFSDLPYQAEAVSQ